MGGHGASERMKRGRKRKRRKDPPPLSHAQGETRSGREGGLSRERGKGRQGRIRRGKERMGKRVTKKKRLA